MRTHMGTTRTRIATFVFCMMLATPCAFAAYQSWTNTTPTGWTGSGTWTPATGGYVASTEGAYLLQDTATPWTGTNAVCFLMRSTGTGATFPDVTVELLDASGVTVLASKTFSSVSATQAKYTFYPFDLNAIPGDGRLRIVVANLNGKSVEIASVFYGKVWAYVDVGIWMPSIDDMTNVGGGWLSNGTVNWTASTGAFSAAVNSQLANASGMLRMRYHLRPPTNDNIIVSFEIYNEAAVVVARNDWLQVLAQTNSYNSTSVQLGPNIYRYDANVAQNTWRKVSVSGYLPGVSQSDSFEIGMQAVAYGSSGRSLQIRNLKIECMTSVTTRSNCWDEVGADTPFNQGTLTFDQAPQFSTELAFRPPQEITNFTYRVVRQHVERGTETDSTYEYTPTSSSAWLNDTNAFLLEAGERIRVRYVCTFDSVLTNNSPYYWPGPTANDWAVDVVTNKGTVWVNEMGGSSGHQWVELASYEGRTLREGWYLVVTDREGVSVTNKFSSGGDFTNQLHNGVAFKVFDLPQTIATQGTVQLFNSANVVEFERNDFTYDGSVTQSWGAVSWGPYARPMSSGGTYRNDWTDYAAHLSFGVTQATQGFVNHRESFELPVSISYRVGTFTTDLNNPQTNDIANVTVWVTNAFSEAQYVTTAVTLTNVPAGYTPVMTSSGSHGNTSAVPVTVIASSFGFYTDPVLVSVPVDEPNKQIPIFMRAGPGRDDFASAKPYWDTQRLMGSSAISWALTAGRMIAATASRLAGDQTVLMAKNGLAARGKKNVTVSLNFLNTPPVVAARIDKGVPLIGNSQTWLTDSSKQEFPAFTPSNTGFANNAVMMYLVNYSITNGSTLDASKPINFGINAIAYGSSGRNLSVGDLLVSFHDMLTIAQTGTAVRITAANNAALPTADVRLALQLWGTNVTRVVPSLIWRPVGYGSWITNSLVPSIQASLSSGIRFGADADVGTFKGDVSGSGVITVTNEMATVFASGIVLTGAPAAAQYEYYVQVAYDPDDADPVRKAAGLNADGSLKNPETRFYPDNAVVSNNTWSAIGLAYSPQPLTNSPCSTKLWINEVSVGGQFIELAGATNTALAGWTVRVYDASGSALALQGIYTLAGSPVRNAANGYGFYVIGSGYDLSLTHALTAPVAIAVYDAQGCVVDSLVFGTTQTFDGFTTVGGSSGAASWLAQGPGRPGNQQYTWADGTTSAGNVNGNQTIQNSGPIPNGTITVVNVTTNSITFRVPGGLDFNGISTNRVVFTNVVSGIGSTNWSRIFVGSTNGTYTVSNLVVNAQYRVAVDYVSRFAVTNPAAIATNRYTLLPTPSAPMRTGRTDQQVALSNAIPYLSQGNTGVAYSHDNGVSWTAFSKALPVELAGLAADTRYDFIVKARNGDGVETNPSIFANYATKPAIPVEIPRIKGDDAEDSWSALMTVTSTNMPAANPADTLYGMMIIHTNTVGGVDTNWLGGVDAFGVLHSTNTLAGAVWGTLTNWNGATLVLSEAPSYFAYVAQARDGGADGVTMPGSFTSVVAALKTVNQGNVAMDTQHRDQTVTLTNKLMNPIEGKDTLLSILYSVSNHTGGAWTEWKTGTLVAAESLLVGADTPSISTERRVASHLTGYAPLAVTNLLALTWCPTNDITVAGHYGLRVKIKIWDDAEAEAETRVTEFVLDTLAADAGFAGIPSAYTKENSAHFTMRADGPLGAERWEYSVTNKTLGSVEQGFSSQADFTVTLPDPAQSEVEYNYAISVVAYDHVGNISSNTASYAWWYDTKAPSESEDTAGFSTPLPPAWIKTNEVSFTMLTNSLLNAVSWEYALTNSVGVTVLSGTTNQTTFTLKGLEMDGVYGIQIWASDTAGNRQLTPTFHRLEKDSLPPPEVAIRGVPPMYTTAQSAFLTVTNPAGTVVQDAVAAWTMVVDGTTVRPGFEFAWGVFTNLTGLVEGPHTVYAWARDAAQNWTTNGTTGWTTNWIVDLTAPYSGFSPEPTVAYTTNHVQNFTMLYPANPLEAERWSYVSSNLTAGIQYGGGTIPQGQSGFTVTIPSTPFSNFESQYCIYITAYDRAGNASSNTAIHAWWYDTKAPTSAFIATAPARTNVNTVNFTMVYDSNPLNAERWSYSVTNKTLGGSAMTGNIPQGQPSFTVTVPNVDNVEYDYEISVTAYDRAGNNSTVPAVYAWAYDTKKPIARFKTIPSDNGTWMTNLAWTITVTGDTQVVAYRYTVDGVWAPSATTEYGISVTNMITVTSQGAHVFALYGCDVAGNWQTVPTTFTWKVDTHAPVAKIMGMQPNVPVWLANNEVYTSNTTFQCSVTNDIGVSEEDTVVRYCWKLERDVNYGSSFTLVSDWSASDLSTTALTPAAPLANGRYRLSVVARDPAGNWQDFASSTVYIWNVDTVAPLDPSTSTIVARPQSFVNTNVVSFTMLTNGPLNAVRWDYVVTNQYGWSSGIMQVLATPLTNAFGYTLPQTDGAYGIKIWASDYANNRQANPSTAAWKMDIVSPTNVVWIGIPPLYTNSTTLAFSVTNRVNATEYDQLGKWIGSLTSMGSTPEAVRPGGELRPGVPMIFAPVDGVYTMYAWVCDLAQNWTLTPFSTNIVVDTVAPVAVVTNIVPGGPLWTLDGLVYTRSTSFSCSVTNAYFAGDVWATNRVVQYRWKLERDATYANSFSLVSDWSAPSVQGTPVTLSTLSDGRYRLSVVACDRAGNWQDNASATTYIWNVDTIVPAADFIQKPESSSTPDFVVEMVSGLPENPREAVSWDFSVTQSNGTFTATNAVSVATNAWHIRLPLLPANSIVTNVIHVTAYDRAGNATVTNWTWNYDTRIPTVLVNVTPYSDTLYAPYWQTNNHLSVCATGHVGVVVVTNWCMTINGTDNVRPQGLQEYLPGQGNAVDLGTRAEGVYVMRFWGESEYGVWQIVPTVITQVIDSVPPVLLLQHVPEVHTNVSAWTFQFAYDTATDSTPYPSNQVVRFDYTLTRNGLAVKSESHLAYAPSLSFVSAEIAAEGNYMLSVWGYDRAGNRQIVATTYSWLQDTTPPVVQSVLAPDQSAPWQTNQNWTVTVTGDVQVVAYRWQLDAGTISALTPTNIPSFGVSSLTDGAHTVKMWGMDRAGNWQSNATAYTRIVDTVAPTAVMTNMVPSTALWILENQVYTRDTTFTCSVTNAMFVGDVNGTNTVVQYRWKLERDADYGSSYTTISDWSVPLDATVAVVPESPLADGRYRLSVVGCDAAGNWQRAAVATTYIWNVDAVEPVAVFATDGMPPARTNVNTACFTVVAAAPLGALRWSYVVTNTTLNTEVLHGVTNQAHFTLTVPSETNKEYDYEISIVSYDVAGNVSPVPARARWCYDTRGPDAAGTTLDIIPDHPAPWQTNTVWTLSVASTDAFAVHYRWILDDPRFPVNDTLTLATSADTSALSDGAHMLRVWVGDSAGNWQTNATVYTRIVDTCAPTVVFDAGTLPSVWTNATSVSIAVTNALFVDDTWGTNTVIQYRWKLDYAADYQNYREGVWSLPVDQDAVFATNNLADGRYCLSVIGRDAAGNWQNEAAATVYIWNVDTVVPIARYDYPGYDRDGYFFTNSLPMTVCFSTTNTMDLKLDAGVWDCQVLGSPLNYAGDVTRWTVQSGELVDQRYAVTLQARDAAGNVSAVVTNFWVYDSTAPANGDVTVTPNVDHAYTNQLSYTFAVTIMGSDWKGNPDTLSLDVGACYAYSFNGMATVTNAVGNTFTVTSAEGVAVTNSVTVWACDRVGNWQSNAVATRYTWVVKTTPPPGVTFDPPITPVTNSWSNFFSVTDSNGEATRWMYVVTGMDGHSVTNWSTSATWSLPQGNVTQDGRYTINVWAFDGAGNMQTNRPATATWLADVTPPVAILDQARLPPTVVNSNTVVFAAVAPNPETESQKWMFSVTNLAGWAWSSLWTNAVCEVVVPARADDHYFVTVTGRDLAGNVQTNFLTQSHFAWVYDSTPPTNNAAFVLQKMPRNPTNVADVVVVMTNDSDIAEWCVVLSKTNTVAGGWLVVSTNFVTPDTFTSQTSALIAQFATGGIDDGAYQVTVIGCDAAGNWQYTPGAAGVWSWIFDSVPPKAIIHEGPVGITSVLTSRFVASNQVDDVCVAWTYRVLKTGVFSQNQVIQNWGPVFEVPEFYVTVEEEGAYTLELLGKDQAGNWQTVVQTSGEPKGLLSWTVDEPSARIISAFRDTWGATNNGGMRVKLEVNLFPVTNRYEFILQENLAHASLIESNRVNISGGVAWWQQLPGVMTNHVKWLIEIEPQNCVTQVNLTYYLTGASSWNGMSGLVKWWEKRTRSNHGYRELWTLPRIREISTDTWEVMLGTPASFMDSYTLWAQPQGLGGRTAIQSRSGYTNEELFNADMSPDSTERFQITRVDMLTGGHVRIYWNAGPAAVIKIYYRKDLVASWQLLETVPSRNANGDPMAEFSLNGNTGGFFKLEAARGE